VLNKDIISDTIPFLSSRDSIDRAQDLMSDFHISHLPIVEENKFLGLINEESLLNATDSTQTLGKLQHEFSRLAVHGGTHFIEAVQLANEYQLSLVPVVDKEFEYLGVITIPELLREAGKTLGSGDPGAIIVLELEKISFSFSEISKLVETNDAQITQLNTFYNTQTSLLYVTLNINKLEISEIIATFQRYEYKIKYFFGEELYENELRSNYDHLMNYLNI
jgi:acetoin utilization protein AcuB